jgi:hypothetical protein
VDLSIISGDNQNIFRFDIKIKPAFAVHTYYTRDHFGHEISSHVSVKQLFFVQWNKISGARVEESLGAFD